MEDDAQSETLLASDVEGEQSAQKAQGNLAAKPRIEHVGVPRQTWQISIRKKVPIFEGPADIECLPNCCCVLCSSTVQVSNIVQASFAVEEALAPFKATCSSLFKGQGPRTIQVASICTGLGVAEMVFDSINFLVNHCLFSGASHELKAKVSNNAFGHVSFISELNSAGLYQSKTSQQSIRANVQSWQLSSIFPAV